MVDKLWAEQLPDEFRKSLMCGSVFHTHVFVEKHNEKCLLFHVQFRLVEGTGPQFSLYFANNHENGTVNIPSQVELLMMDIDCAPTWPWHYVPVSSRNCREEYIGEFAHYNNYKCVGDSGASRFPVTL